MSMMRCDDCERLIDTDYRPDVFLKDPATNAEMCLCGTCRDKWERAHGRELEEV